MVCTYACGFRLVDDGDSAPATFVLELDDGRRRDA